METVSFEPARWWNQAFTPIFHYHSSCVVGRKRGTRQARQLWGVKELRSVKQGKCFVAFLFLLHPGYDLGHAQRIVAVFPAAERRCVIAWLRDAQYYLCALQPCKDGLSKTYGSRCWRDKETHFKMSWALLDEQEGPHSSFAQSC